MVFNEVIDNSIVIIPSNFKSFLRNYKFINYKLNFKVFSKEDLKKELFGKKSDEIIGFLLKNSNYTFDFINTFLDYFTATQDKFQHDRVVIEKSMIIYYFSYPGL